MKAKQILFLFFVLTNLVMAAWYVFHGDIVFSADIARDFFLYQEISQKKLMLIGPRSSVSGLFHGPLWAYLNYPAYWLGRGNPVVVGWYWLLLSALFLVASFKIAGQLFTRSTAYAYVAMLSVYLVFHAKGLFNPHGVFFLLPWFFFLLVRYLETNKINYLMAHVVVAGLLIQFELAIGIPYFILSSVLLIYRAVKNKNRRHLPALLLIFLSLVNFLIFDLRHDFILLQSVPRFLFSHVTNKSLSYGAIMANRLQSIVTGTEFLRENPYNLRFLVTVIFGILIWRQIKDHCHRLTYQLFLYFYFGYFILSLVNKGFILYFYLYPQFSLIFLIFASLVMAKRRQIFIPIFLLILMFNFATAIKNTRQSNGFIGKNVDSWRFLYQLSRTIYEQPEEEFGYFVYSPDAFGYQPKYAMLYTGSLFADQAVAFEKKPVTYIIAAPHPFMEAKWWKENQIKILAEPEAITKFANGYQIEKYLLEEKQVEVPFDPSINPGIHFR